LTEPTSTTGSNAVTGSYGTLACSHGLMTMLPDGLNNSVRPSGAALATAFIPTMPPAPPPLFSTTKLSFGRSLPSPFARMRAIGSSAPPGAYGITIRIVSAAAGAARKQSATIRPDSRRMD